ncbi:unnamed protein product [Fusarium fujikuroi]|nr:unnamed protein product [Fusarium fujikuroi]
MAPAGDSLAEPITVAGLRAEVLDEKRASISAEKRASIVTDPRPATADAGAVAPAGGVTPDGQFPTAEELGTLRRVPNKIPMKLFSIAFVELCERFSYYGCTVVFTNFIQHKLPDGSTTGADPKQPGALDMGQRASTGITTFNQFWQYFMPLLGAYIADQYWGRYKTISWALGIDIIGHIILIMSAIPPVISNQGGALGAMIIAIIVIGFGTGGFKPNVNPLIVEQLGEQYMHVKTLKSGERVIVDPAVTIERVYLDDFWEKVKPSNFSHETRPKWMTFDDAWVDELSRGFNACAVFCWYPIFWLCYNQINNNLISQAAVMQRHGVPNDILSNLNPFALLIFIPLNDFFIYPALRKAGFRFTPIKKITAGFFTGAAAMIWAAVVQHYIYQKSECGMYASGEIWSEAEGKMVNCAEAPINVWAQTGSYVLIALSEVFASITSLEYAFSKAPKNMRSMVQAVALFMTAFSAALGQALVGLAADPLLVWNYGVVAILAVIAGTCFWLQFKDLDIHEDDLNALPEGHAGATADEEAPLGSKRVEE